MTQDIAGLADAIDPRIFRSKAMMGRARSKYPVVATAYPPDQKWLIPAADLFAASDALRSLTTAVEIGRAMGIEAAAKWHEEIAASYEAGRPPTIPLGDDYGESDVLTGMFKDYAELHRRYATAIRSAPNSLDVEALTETVARAAFDSMRRERGMGWGDIHQVRKDTYLEIATAVLRSLGIGGTAA